MHVMIPGRVRKRTSFPQGGSGTAIYANGKYNQIPLVETATFTESSSYFYDTKGRKFNDCVHSKLISSHTDASYNMSDGNYYLPTQFVNPNVTYSYGGSFVISWIAEKGRTTWVSVSVGCYRRLTRYYIGNVSIGVYVWNYSGRQEYWDTLYTTWTTEWLNDERTSGIFKCSSSYTGSSFPRSNGYSYGSIGIPFDIERGYGSESEAARDAFSRFNDYGYAVGHSMSANAGQNTYGQRQGYVSNPRVDWSSVPSRESLAKDFSLSEIELTVEGYDALQLAKIQYWRNWLIQHAYLDALQNAPRLNENSISNIVEIIGFIKALVVDHRIDIPKSLSKAWLSYRYQYTTSKLDAEEAIDFVHRYMDLDGLDKGIKCFGSSNTTIDGKLVTCRCGLTLTPKELGTLKKVWRALYTYGLQPNFYVVWDMIPYSFIVDWFIPIGDAASVLDAEAMYMGGENYNISNVIFSLSYDTHHNSYDSHQYSRWSSAPLEHFNEFYWFDKPKASKKQVAFRILDAASLLIGH